MKTVFLLSTVAGEKVLRIKIKPRKSFLLTFMCATRVEENCIISENGLMVKTMAVD